ncbi:2,5-didehydrogluconate reductase DkgA [Martelella alba]|uniref:2,5-didehydrogluconate reductase DkgA n=1 Tax=Martelella alba TaxID=2590451 RepID=A0ABY2SJX0_9HYPH|nr:2,5-didehydrogluconate reductase DkgA [Martelella alba]TKI04934.1 2,5-didehydrogluconate reductase DkgA [Martelella alba]
MATQPSVTFHDGRTMPQFGLGVWQATNEQAASSVQEALRLGYRSIDTAAIYGNEEGVGRGLKAAGLPREEVFITTKLWNADQHIAPKAMEESLKKLQLDYVDLYLMHWPVPSQDIYVQAWRDMVKLKEEGLARSVGVCNFHVPHLQRLLDETGVAPVINQIELHPLLQQRELSLWNADHNIVTEAWSPLAQGGKGVFDQPIIAELAKKYGKTPAQIVIRWHLDSDRVVIPKSVTPSRIKENVDVFDFRLEKSELDAIARLDSGKRLGPNPDTFVKLGA